MASIVADEGEAGLYANAAKAGHDLFDVYDADGDGFITAEEWGGSMAVFAALDTDGDGILSREEVATGMGNEFSRQARTDNRRAELAAHLAAKTSDDEEEADEDDDGDKEASMSDADREQMIEDAITASSDLSAVEHAMLAEMLAERTADQNDPGSTTLAPDSHGLVPEDNSEMVVKDEDVDQAKVAVKADDDDAEGDDAEGDEGSDEGDDDGGDKEAAAKSSDEEEADEEEADDEGDKEASFISDQLDPMGLSNAVEADDTLLTDLFGITTAAKSSDEEEADDDDEDSDKEASAKSSDEEEADDDDEDEKASSKKSSLRPRGRKPSAGAKSLGSVTGKTASNEIGDLEKLWSSAPDVSNVFGS
jgi:hypothetical protein